MENYNAKLKITLIFFATIFAVLIFSFTFLIPNKSAKADISSGLVGHWEFDETSGVTANDSSGKNNNGTLNPPAGGPTWTTGKINNALSFDGVDDYVNIANEANFDFERTNSFSVCAWIKTNTITSGTIQTITGKLVNSGSYNGWEFDLFDGSSLPNSLYFSLENSYPSNRIAVKGPTIMANTWYHMCATYNGNSSASGMYLYYNGVNQSLTPVADSLTASILNNQSVEIGYRWTEGVGGSWPFNGLIDEVRIYNRALSASDIQEVYNSGIPAPVCGDIICSGSETCSTCPQDCGACPIGDTQPPTVPTNLSASAVSSSQINLSWTISTDNIGVTGYKVFRNGAQIATPTTNSYSDTGLSPSTSYTYTVSAYDAVPNNSAQSSSASATTQGTASACPSANYELCGANCFRACDLSQTKIQATIDAANTNWNGNYTDYRLNPTVLLPAGTSPWWTVGLNTYGGINIIGAGSPNSAMNGTTKKWEPFPTTIIRYAFSAGTGGAINVNDIGGKTVRDATFRIANIYFLGNGVYGQIPKNAIMLRSGGIGFRIDHCTFDTGYKGYQYTLHIGSNWAGAASTGVIDHNNFRNCEYAILISRREFIQSKPLGTSDAVYVEDNYFDNVVGHAISGFAAAHWVFRYNWYADDVGGVGGLDVHGPGWDEDNTHGGGPWEIYENDFVGNSGAFPLDWGPIRLRSTFGVIFNNRFSYFRHASQYDCDGTTLLDCPGRSGTTIVGIYIWGNTYTGMDSNPDEDQWHWIEPMYCHTQNYTRYDYEIFGYNDGRGGNTGTPKPGYTPYTYPHPLTLGSVPPSDTTPPAAPSGVTII